MARVEKSIFDRIALAAGLLLSGACACASSVTVNVSDASGAAVPDAVVYAEAIGAQSLPKVLKMAEIEQQKQHFLPLVTVLQVGAVIAFPNRDRVRHQVYSFSPAKIFELKLYAGVPAAPVLFDKVGTVVLGCNIHDEMVAYVHVVNTPYFAKTDVAGRARLENVPEGSYVLKTWHYNMPANTTALERTLTLPSVDASIDVKLGFKNKIEHAEHAL